LSLKNFIHFGRRWISSFLLVNELQILQDISGHYWWWFLHEKQWSLAHYFALFQFGWILLHLNYVIEACPWQTKCGSMLGDVFEETRQGGKIPKFLWQSPSSHDKKYSFETYQRDPKVSVNGCCWKAKNVVVVPSNWKNIMLDFHLDILYSYLETSPRRAPSANPTATEWGGVSNFLTLEVLGFSWRFSGLNTTA